MNRRPGITLIEVLVAIFIMGIGMIALLTLFPLGAINIAQALRDDRAAQAATNASAYANAQNVRHDTTVTAAFTAELTGNFEPNGPSSPVYVDGFYVDLAAGNLGAVAGVGGITRVKPAYAANSTAYWFSLLDDLNFDQNGVPTQSGGAVERTGRYTWAYMLRRPRVGDESVVDMSVVVYSDRSTQTVAGEDTYTAAVPAAQLLTTPPAAGFTPTTTITFNYAAGNKPKIKNGSWILDVTRDRYRNASTKPVRTWRPVRGYFYRVVDAAENATNSSFTLELQTPLRAPPQPENANVVLTVNGTMTFVVMEHMIDVFDRGTGPTP